MTSLRTYLLFGVAVALLLGAAPAQAGDFYDPVGTDDRADCTRLAGWAKDGDTTLPIQVHIYKGGPHPYGTFVTAVVANLYRSDLPFADKNHGYSIPTPSAFFTGCPETVYVHAIDVDTNGNNVPGGTNTLLSNTGRTIRCGTPDPSCLPDRDPPQQ
jgi:hypothetical protein